MFSSKAAAPLPLWLEPDRVRVEAMGTGPWIVTGIGYSPLWRARVAAGDLSTRRGVTGLLEVERPPAAGDVELRYAPSLPEWAGLAVSAASVLLLAVVAYVARGSDPAVARGGRSPRRGPQAAGGARVLGGEIANGRGERAVAKNVWKR